jgi:hypothetical protein
MPDPEYAPLLSAALDYASQGFAVFPCHDVSAGACSCGQDCASPGKHPRTGSGFKDATTDPATIKRWWAVWPRANVAIATGSVSDGLVVVDVDVKKGAEGDTTLAWLIKKHPEFVDTFRILTPSKGTHCYFRGVARSNQNALGKGVDVRGEGGYVLVPPSVVFGQYDEAKKPVPGSQAAYTILHSAPILPYPIAASAPGSFMLGDMVERSVASDQDREGVPYGQHREAVLKLAWTLRRVQGLTVEAALPLLQTFCESALLDYDRSKPFTDRDLRGMLEGVEAHVAAAITEKQADTSTIDATEVAYVPTEWLLDGFVAKGELTLLYGDGGIGKSSYFSWLAAHVTNMGMRFGFIGVEEPFSRFAARAHVQGADRTRLFGFRQQPDIKLNNLELVEKFIRERELDVLYFDSIMTHFNQVRQGNAATDARDNLGPLARIAEFTRCTIVGTFHTNKEGDYSGSTEKSNVSRTFLEAKSLGDSGDKFTVRVDKSNFQKPDYKLVFRRSSLEIRHHATGDVLYDIIHTPSGIVRRPATVPFLQQLDSVPESTFTLGDAVGGSGHDEEIRALLTTEPGLSANKIIERLGVSQGKKMYDAIKRIKAELA